MRNFLKKIFTKINNKHILKIIPHILFIVLLIWNLIITYQSKQWSRSAFYEAREASSIAADAADYSFRAHRLLLR